MGYTHYWYIDEELKEFNKDILNPVYLVCNLYKDLLDNKTDQKITIEKDLICFNGIGEDSHETFFINLPMTKEEFIQYHEKDKNKIFGFCKTARKPYDIAVCEVLLILKYWLKDKIIVSSDGNFNEEWLQARDEIKRRFGYNFKYINSTIENA